jgi:hypothetical protein
VESTAKKVLGGIGVLIFAYLALVYSGGFSTDVKATTSGGTGVIQALQGR